MSQRRRDPACWAVSWPDALPAQTPMLLSPPPPPSEFAGEPNREPLESPGTDTLLWLVRHGRVTAPTTAYGDEDVPLSEEGLGQTALASEALANQARPNRIVASPLIRARTLGEQLAERTGLPLRLDPRLKELHRGDWQGIERTEYQARWRADREAYWQDPLHWKGHGGESEAEVVARAWAALSDALNGFQAAGTGPTGCVVIAAHRQVIRALTAAAMGIPPGRSHSMRLEPAHGILLQASPGAWTLLRTNIFPPGAKHATEPVDGPPKDVIVR